MIKRSLTTVFLVGLMAMVFVANAQRKSEISSKIKSINGKEYYIHHVKKGETLYGLSSTYKVSVEEIEDLNPKTKEGLKADDIIHIPVRVRKKTDPKPVVKEPEHEQVVVKTDSVKEVEPVVKQLDSVKEPELVVEATDSSVIIEKITDNVEAVTAIVEPMGKDTIVVTLGGYYVVEEGENLYDIAKKFGIDLADFKAINPGLDNNPMAETMIKVPNVVNEKDYIVHKVEYNERTSSMLKRWKVKEKQFRAKNVSVGSHVFVNQIVLIPIEPVVVRPELAEVEIEEQEEVSDDQVLVDEKEMDNLFLDEIPYDLPECQASPENARRRYKVALMVPLYLRELDGIDMSKEKAAQVQRSRPLSFLQFYEGFMMAAEKLEKERV